MRILVTGAYGLIGSACLARLHGAGHELIAAGRSTAAGRRRFSYARWITADFGRLRDAAAWQPLLRDVDAVVNCVGVLQDGLRDDVRRVQLAGTVALFDGCARAGVRRVVHISAIGAEAGGPTAFSRTKAAAEAHLRELDLDWVILRPAVVLAPAVYGATAMMRAVAAFPLVVPVIRAGARLQVVGVGDVAETVARVLIPGAPSRVTWDVAHPQVHELAALVGAIRGWLGFAPRPVLRLPDGLAAAIAGLADAAGWLGWRSPARSTSLAQLACGVIGDPAPWTAASGIRPRDLEQILAAHPASVQDRWFARLYLIKPLAIVGLAAATIGPGLEALLAFWRLRAELYGVPWAAFAVHILPLLAFSAITLLAGLALLVRASARVGLLALLILNLLQAANHIVAAWRFAASPLGALSIDIPVILAALFMLAILDDR